MQKFVSTVKKGIFDIVACFTADAIFHNQPFVAKSAEFRKIIPGLYSVADAGDLDISAINNRSCNFLI